MDTNDPRDEILERFLDWIHEQPDFAPHPPTMTWDTFSKIGAPSSYIRTLGVIALSDVPDEVFQSAQFIQGYEPMKQYECLKKREGDQDFLYSTIEVNPDTRATEAKSTDPHMDAYQFWCLYLGEEIAGIGNMPDLEVLGYPHVAEWRHLNFLHLPSAIRKMLRCFDGDAKEFIRRLMEPVFNIQNEFGRNNYCDKDKDLEYPDKFAVITADEKWGFRFHIGGSVSTDSIMHRTALETLRVCMALTLISTKVREGHIYLIHQPMIAHAGMRVADQKGQTVLTRTLLKYTGEEE